MGNVDLIPSAERDLSREHVLLVHGFMGGFLDLWPLQLRVRNHGFRTRIWTYRSTLARLDSIAAKLQVQMQNLESITGIDRWHVVTHSMGGIALRLALRDWLPSKLWRIVMLTPPNRGSFAARWLSPALGWLWPTLSEISDSAESLANQVASPFVHLQQRGVHLGIVRSTVDRVIAPDCVELDGSAALHDVNIHHAVVGWSATCAQLVNRWLLHGTFAQPDTVAQPGESTDS